MPLQLLTHYLAKVISTNDVRHRRAEDADFVNLHHFDVNTILLKSTPVATTPVIASDCNLDTKIVRWRDMSLGN
jgi:hypothetical protein